ncbi:hypothetical protein VTK26DRAFT_2858 [Humicola hyalothermophila]
MFMNMLFQTWAFLAAEGMGCGKNCMCVWVKERLRFLLEGFLSCLGLQRVGYLILHASGQRRQRWWVWAGNRVLDITRGLVMSAWRVGRIRCRGIMEEKCIMRYGGKLYLILSFPSLQLRCVLSRYLPLLLLFESGMYERCDITVAHWLLRTGRGRGAA